MSPLQDPAYAGSAVAAG